MFRSRTVYAVPIGQYIFSRFLERADVSATPDLNSGCKIFFCIFIIASAVRSVIFVWRQIIFLYDTVFTVRARTLETPKQFIIFAERVLDRYSRTTTYDTCRYLARTRTPANRPRLVNDRGVRRPTPRRSAGRLSGVCDACRCRGRAH